jgi:hypothetical protein
MLLLVSFVIFSRLLATAVPNKRHDILYLILVYSVSLSPPFGMLTKLKIFMLPSIQFLGGKGGRCVGLTTLPPSCADCLKNLGASTSWIPKGLSRPVMGMLYLYPLSKLLGKFRLSHSSYRSRANNIKMVFSKTHYSGC